LGDGAPDKDEFEDKEGSDSLLEWDEENRTVECLADEWAVERIGDPGAIPLLGRDLVLVLVDLSSLSTTSSSAGTGMRGIVIVGEDVVNELMSVILYYKESFLRREED